MPILTCAILETVGLRWRHGYAAAIMRSYHGQKWSEREYDQEQRSQPRRTAEHFWRRLQRRCAPRRGRRQRSGRCGRVAEYNRREVRREPEQWQAEIVISKCRPERHLTARAGWPASNCGAGSQLDLAWFGGTTPATKRASPAPGQRRACSLLALVGAAIRGAEVCRETPQTEVLSCCWPETPDSVFSAGFMVGRNGGGGRCLDISRY